MQAVVEKISHSRLPTRHGEFAARAYRNTVTGIEHLVLSLGELSGGPVLARVHSECLTGDVFGSQRCDCGEQLDLALSRIAGQQRGVLIYLRGQEGRGIGLANKVRAYQLQDAGLDTVDANLALGLPVDARRYEDAIEILRDLGIEEVCLMSNNPAKSAALLAGGIRITEQVPHFVATHRENQRYIETKRVRMGHVMDGAWAAKAPSAVIL